MYEETCFKNHFQLQLHWLQFFWQFHHITPLKALTDRRYELCKLLFNKKCVTKEWLPKFLLPSPRWDNRLEIFLIWASIAKSVHFQNSFNVCSLNNYQSVSLVCSVLVFLYYYVFCVFMLCVFHCVPPSFVKSSFTAATQINWVELSEYFGKNVIIIIINHFMVCRLQ